MKIAGLTLIACAVFALSTPVRAQGGCGTLSLDKYLEHPNVVAIVRRTVTTVKPVRESLSDRALGVNGVGCDVMTVDRPAAVRIMDPAAGYAPQP